MIIRGYEYKATHNTHCTGCKRVIGPDTDNKVGFLVKDGEVTGLFHSKPCYENTVAQFEQYKKDNPKEA